MTKRIRLTRAESQALTRERLLNAAYQVFARLGYGGTSVDMIAAEAGYSKGAVYSNFASKEAIFLELLDRYGEEEIAAFTRILPLDADDMRVALTDRLTEIHKDDDWALLEMELALHARRNPEFAKRFYAIEKRLTDFHAGFITELFASHGREPPLDPAMLSLAIRTISAGANLKIPATGARTPNAAGQMIKDLIDYLLDNMAPDTPPKAASGKARARKSQSKSQD